MPNNIIDTYREHLARVGKSPHTVRAYTLDVAAFASWFEQTTGREFGPRIVDPMDIGEYRGFLIQRGKKPATVNRCLIALRRFFEWALKEGQVQTSPFEILERVFVKEQQDTVPKWLSRSEQLNLLRPAMQAEKWRDVAVLQTLLGTGLRVSELVGLNVGDVEIKDRSGKLRVRAGKGTKARSIPLDNRTRQALNQYVEKVRETHKQKESERFFLGERGPLNEPGVYYLVTKYAYDARLEDVTPHTLRHSFGKNLVDAGVPLDQVATLLGHERLDTVRIYTRPSEADLEKAVRKGAGELFQRGVDRPHND